MQRHIWHRLNKQRIFCLLGVLSLLNLATLSEAGWLEGASHQIVIVKGTISLPEADAGDRPFASSLANQASIWLDELGLHHTMLTDEKITTGALRGARVVMLPYNPDPSTTELEAFRSVIQSDGILLVFYGMNQTLAGMMGMTIASYRRAETRGQWSRIVFDQAGLSGLPRAIHQISDHLVPVYPNSCEAQIIARWTDASGNPADEPAMVRSRAGFWMSHVLLPGDDEAKKQMLLAMLATAIPDVWQRAADKLLDPARPFGHYVNQKAAQQDLGWTEDSARSNAVESSFLQGKRGGPSGYLAARALRSALSMRYAQRENFSNSFPLRGIWVAGDVLQTPDIWSHLESNGINSVFMHVGQPLALTERSGWPSFLPNNRLAVHAWLTCLNIETSTAAQIQELRDQSRLQVSDTGETLKWLCPSHPANRALLRDTATRLARDGRLAGIHLDYIRCNNIHSCYCAGCRERFESELGRAVGKWPADVQNGSLTEVFRQWRAGQITAIVAEISGTVRAVNPAMKVSAAVFGATPSCLVTVAQNWPAWADRGLLDFVCPMNYTSDLKQFECLLETHSSLSCASRIIPGLGLASSLSRLTADQTVAELIQIRKAGFQGFVLFEFSPAVEADVLPCLGLKKASL